MSYHFTHFLFISWNSTNIDFHIITLAMVFTSYLHNFKVTKCPKKRCRIYKVWTVLLKNETFSEKAEPRAVRKSTGIGKTPTDWGSQILKTVEKKYEPFFTIWAAEMFFFHTKGRMQWMICSNTYHHFKIAEPLKMKLGTL